VSFSCLFILSQVFIVVAAVFPIARLGPVGVLVLGFVKEGHGGGLGAGVEVHLLQRLFGGGGFFLVAEVIDRLQRVARLGAADVAERGIVLTGGGGLMRDIDKLIMEETGLNVVIAEDPLTCVAPGGGRVLELIAKDERAVEAFAIE